MRFKKQTKNNKGDGIETTNKAGRNRGRTLGERESTKEREVFLIHSITTLDCQNT